MFPTSERRPNLRQSWIAPVTDVDTSAVAVSPLLATSLWTRTRAHSHCWRKRTYMGGRLSQLGLVALVTLLYSGRDARPVALCNGCPELFAGRPAAPAQKAAQPQHRSQSGRQHAHHAQLSWHERRKRPLTFTTAGRASFKAFA